MVSESAWREVTRPHMAINANWSYGLGWALCEWNSRQVVEQNGGSRGLSALVSVSPTSLTRIGEAGPLLWPILLGESAPAAEELLARVAAAAGGERNIRRHTSMEARYEKRYLNQGVDAELLVRAKVPNLLAEEESWSALRKPIGAVAVRFDGSVGGQETTFGQDETYSGAELERLLLEMKRAYERLAVMPGQPIGDEEVLILAGRAGNETGLFHVSARTGLVLRTAWSAEVATFSDFRNVEGVVVAHAIHVRDTLGESSLVLRSLRFDVALPGEIRPSRSAPPERPRPVLAWPGARLCWPRPMRFLHTADWHVGKTLRGRARMDEFAAAIDEVARVAVEARVDAVLLAGDVFDSPAPAPEAERLVYDFLARLLPERISCVVIAGNHDHPRKLAALSRLLEGLRIHVRAEVRPPGKGGVVALPSRDGAETAQVAVLPFVPERKAVEACQLMEPEYAWYEEYSARIEQILGRLAAAFTPGAVHLALAHVLVDGARVGTGERPLHLGEIYGLNAQQLPAGVQYIGLGHLHRPQEILAPSPTFYAGSLIELDFGEREQDKRVVVVEARPGRPATIESVPVPAGRRLRDVAGTLPELRRMAPGLAGDYLRVRVRADGPVPGLADQVRDLLPDALDVSVEYERMEPKTGETPRLQNLRPAELFTDFFSRRNGASPPPELLALFEDVYEEATRS